MSCGDSHRGRSLHQPCYDAGSFRFSGSGQRGKEADSERSTTAPSSQKMYEALGEALASAYQRAYCRNGNFQQLQILSVKIIYLQNGKATRKKKVLHHIPFMQIINIKSK